MGTRADTHEPREAPRLPAAVRLLAVPAAVAAALLLVTWQVIARLGPADREGQIVLGAVTFAALALVIGRLARRRRDLRMPVRLAVWGTAALALGGFWWTSVRDTVVDETVAVAPAPAADPAPPAADPAPEPAAKATPEPAPARPRPAPAPANVLLGTGTFVGLDGHGAVGTARAIDLAEGGRVVTLTGFDVDPGPDVLVYLSPDPSTTSGDIVDLGRLKGNVGDQQYVVPAGVDLGRHDTVLLWCRAFSVRMAAAELSTT